MPMQRKRPSNRTWVRYAAVSVAVVVTLVAAGLFGAGVKWRRDVAREVAAIEASGAPLTPREFELEATAQPPWWGDTGARPDPVFELRLDEPAALAALLGRPGADIGPFERGSLEALAAQYDELAARGESVDGAWIEAMRAWPPGAGDAPVGALVELVHRIQLEAERDLLACASGACTGARFDAKAWVDEWLASDELLPEFPGSMSLIGIQKALARQAWVSALDGDEEVSVEHVRLGFCAARACEQTPGVFPFLVWLYQVDTAIQSLMRVARFLPSAELGEFDGQLASLDVDAHLVRALEEERAILYFAFSRSWPDEEVDWQGHPFRFVLDAYDRRVFLHSFRDVLGAARRSAAEARAVARSVDERLRSERFAPRSQLVMPSVKSLAESVMALEVSATLARAVLLGRRDGVEAARQWIAAQRDPFSGGPYLTADDSDGGLRVWSVGRDGFDDGGVTGEDHPGRADITARLRRSP